MGASFFLVKSFTFNLRPGAAFLSSSPLWCFFLGLSALGLLELDAALCRPNPRGQGQSPSLLSWQTHCPLPPSFIPHRRRRPRPHFLLIAAAAITVVSCNILSQFLSPSGEKSWVFLCSSCGLACGAVERLSQLWIRSSHFEPPVLLPSELRSDPRSS